MKISCHQKCVWDESGQTERKQRCVSKQNISSDNIVFGFVLSHGWFPLIKQEGYSRASFHFHLRVLLFYELGAQLTLILFVLFLMYTNEY